MVKLVALFCFCVVMVVASLSASFSFACFHFLLCALCCFAGFQRIRRKGSRSRPIEL